MPDSDSLDHLGSNAKPLFLKQFAKVLPIDQFDWGRTFPTCLFARFLGERTRREK